MRFDNRVTRMLGVGGLGIIETSSGELDAVRPVAEIVRDTVSEFAATLERLSKTYLDAAPPRREP